jgi:hypothetical protein
MADGNLKRVSQITRGDYVKTCFGEGKVACTLRGSCLGNLSKLVELKGGLLITPYHPIRINRVWQFPCDIAQTNIRSCEFIYNFVLENGHTMEINGIECVTLAHHFKENIVKHDYFGTEAVIIDLKNM